MFKNNTNNPEYLNIVFFDTVKNRTISQINETDASLLNAKINQIKKGDDEKLDEAILSAKKMAVYYGVPGLLQYVNLNVMIMKHEKAQGEIVQQQAFNTFVYLQLAEKLYTQNPDKFNRLIKDLLPAEDVSSPVYWQEKKEELIKLGSLENIFHEAIEEGERMFNECQPSQSRKTSK